MAIKSEHLLIAGLLVGGAYFLNKKFDETVEGIKDWPGQLMPDIKVPDINVDIPDITFPKLPDITLPDINVDIPDINIPSANPLDYTNVDEQINAWLTDRFKDAPSANPLDYTQVDEWLAELFGGETQYSTSAVSSSAGPTDQTGIDTTTTTSYADLFGVTGTTGLPTGNWIPSLTNTLPDSEPTPTIEEIAIETGQAQFDSQIDTAIAGWGPSPDPNVVAVYTGISYSAPTVTQVNTSSRTGAVTSHEETYSSGGETFVRFVPR